jgi:hypothetical protein
MMVPAFHALLLAWSLVGSTVALNSIPYQDEFYDPPEGWRNQPNGAVLKTRFSAYDLPAVIQNVQDTFQIMYRSIDSWGNDTWGVTTVFIPPSHNISSCRDDLEDLTLECAHGLVVYQCPYDTVNPNSAASYIAQFGEAYGDMKLSLGRGWFVSLTDYEGPLAAFSAGVQAGHSILDSIPAVLKVARDHYGFRGNDTTTAMWGYSGGGQATGMAAELAATYAPHLKLAGAVVGGPPPDLRSSMDIVNGRETSGLLIASLIGITVQRPDVWEDLLSRLKPEGPYNRTGFLTGYRTTGSRALAYFLDQDVYEYFVNGYDDVWTPELIEIYDQDGVMGKHGTPNMPMFVYLAVNDGFFKVPEADALIQKYCDEGANILYHRNIVGHHKTELTNGRQRALNYLGYVLNGDRDIEVPETGCKCLDVSEWVDPDTIR